MTDWKRLLNTNRRRPSSYPLNTRKEGRREFERDYDRILFSTPVRRMADKTQLFPLEAHDAVHTRLTHSHEVSALARSVGLDMAKRFRKKLGMPPDRNLARDLSALLAAVGLVHDIGNPPFGHQGEAAIRSWFKRNKVKVFKGPKQVPSSLQQDFLKFEGNAQSLRLVTRLQVQGDEFGLNLTYGTLATLLKYTVRSADVREGKLAGSHKPGFFKTEEVVVEEIWKATGLSKGQRHPLAYIVEACDDIAYGVIDVEDTVKKDLASFADVETRLRDFGGGDRVIESVLEDSRRTREKISRSPVGARLSPKELDDRTMQAFRVSAMSAMVAAALDAFVTNFPMIDKGTFAGDLLSAGSAEILRDGLEDFKRKIAFPDRSILEIELRGALVISELMDRFWSAITDRQKRSDPTSSRANRLSAYTYSRISENYRREFEQSGSGLPIAYREAQLLTDMISGMTDTYALSLLDDLRANESY